MGNPRTGLCVRRTGGMGRIKGIAGSDRGDNEGGGELGRRTAWAGGRRAGLGWAGGLGDGWGEVRCHWRMEAGEREAAGAAAVS